MNTPLSPNPIALITDALRLIKAALAVSIAFNASPLVAQSFPIDAGYGTSGVARSSALANADHRVTAHALDGQGKLLVATRSSLNDVATLSRLNDDGQIDTSFGDGGSVFLNVATAAVNDKTAILSLVALADGKVALATGRALYRLDSSGRLDAGYGVGGRLDLTELAIYAYLGNDGRAVVVSQATGTNTLTLRLQRIEADGRRSLAPTLLTLVGALDAERRVVQMTRDGNDWAFLVADQVTSSARAAQLFRARTDVNGMVDSTTLRSDDISFPEGSPRGVVDGSLVADGSHWFWISSLSRWLEDSFDLQYVVRASRNASAGGAPETLLDTRVDGRPNLNSPSNRPPPKLLTLAAAAGYVLAARAEFDQASNERRFTVRRYFASNSVEDLSFSRLSLANGDGHLILDSQANLRVIHRTVVKSACIGLSPCRNDYELKLSRWQISPNNNQLLGSERIITPKQASGDEIHSIVTASDGGLLMAGLGWDSNTASRYVAWKLTSNGALDSGFGSVGRATLEGFPRCTGPVRADRVAPNLMWIAAQNTNGTVCSVAFVSAWQVGPDGASAQTTVNTLATTGNGMIAVAALADGGAVIATAADASRSGVVTLTRLRPDRSVNSAFGVGGVLTLSPPAVPCATCAAPGAALASLPNGQIALALTVGDRLYFTQFDQNTAGSPAVVWRNAPLTSGQVYSTRSLRVSNKGDAWMLLSGSSGYNVVHANWLDTTVSVFSQFYQGRGVDIATGSDGSAVVLANANDRGYQLSRLARSGNALLTQSMQDFAGPDSRGWAYPTALHLRDATPSSQVVVAGIDGEGSFLRRHSVAATPAASAASVVEYFNTTLRHYFVTASRGEQTSLETGGAGPGWQRLNAIFKAYETPTVLNGLASTPVCRFYGKPNVGPNSHFYTFEGGECEAVKRDPGWQYEGIAFHLFKPTAAGCAAGLTAVYRSYNNGFVRNDSNHRYYSDPALAATMQAQGWSPEGIVFCAP